MIKVSIVVPTYSPGPGLDRVIDSLDAQTLPQHEFESVFVDDGSPDDTLARLHELARTRPNMRVTSIPNSGWPSRPRNVGLDMAQGEFVVFMDHDDYLYPRALEVGYEAGAAQRADVVNAKEVRTNELFAYWPAFQRDIDASAPKRPQSLSPWTTHKMFRRSLLLDNGIRFEEGARVLWEDVMVDVSVYAATDRITVLASEPFYQWVHSPGENASSTYGDDLGQLVGSVAKMFEHVDASTVDDEFAAYMKSYQYGTRILHQFVGPRAMRRTPDKVAEGLDLALEFARTSMPVELDARLSKPHQARSVLLRAERLDLVRSLAEADRDIVCIPTATAVTWDGGRLVVEVEGTWTQDEQPVTFRRDGDRLLRVLPHDVAEALPAALLDVADQLPKAALGAAVTHLDTRVGWALPVEFETVEEPRPDLGAGLVSVGVRGRITIDPTTAAFGKELEDGTWTVSVRSGFAGVQCHRAVRYAGRPAVGNSAGRPAAALAAGEGPLVLDLGVARSALAVTTPDYDAAVVRRRGTRLQVPLRRITAADLGQDRPMELRLQPLDRRGDAVEGTGRIEADGDEVVFRGDLPSLPPGRYRLLVRDTALGSLWATRLVLARGRLGRASLLVRPVNRKRYPRVWGRT